MLQLRRLDGHLHIPCTSVPDTGPPPKCLYSSATAAKHSNTPVFPTCVAPKPGRKDDLPELPPTSTQPSYSASFEDPPKMAFRIISTNSFEVHKGWYSKGRCTGVESHQIIRTDIVEQRCIKSCKKSFFQLDRRYDSSSRTLTADILIELQPTDQLLEDLLNFLLFNDTAFEIKQYVFQGIKMIADDDLLFKERAQEIIRKNNQINTTILAFHQEVCQLL